MQLQSFKGGCGSPPLFLTILKGQDLGQDRALRTAQPQRRTDVTRHRGSDDPVPQGLPMPQNVARQLGRSMGWWVYRTGRLGNHLACAMTQTQGEGQSVKLLYSRSLVTQLILEEGEASD